MLKFLCFIFIISPHLYAREYRPFDFDLKRSNPEEKGIFWGPFFSFLVPGSNQWYEEQYDQAMFFSGLGVSGILLSRSASLSQKELDDSQNDGGFNDEENNRYRTYQLGGQIYQVAGGLSAYASFQSTVKYRQEKNNEYEFIKEPDTVDEILTAPFDFGFLKRPTTYWPLGLLLGAVVLSDGISTGELTGADAFYTSAFSYNAGTHEEAMFRGWLMPIFQERFQSAFWGNMTSSALFAAAHGFSPPPIPQFLVGYYLGWLTQRNDYSLREAVFIHVWWDVIAIASSYMDSNSDNDQMLYIPIYAGAF